MKNSKIAIVGMSCRFPGGVTGPDEFWSLLENEKDAVTQIPADRFGTEFYQHPSKREPGKSYTFSAGVLDNVAGFDAAFFGISPREATQMDPQQRLLLELTWEAFEDAGVRPEALRGSDCAVYVGVASTDYGNRNMDDLNTVDPYSATGNTLSIASNRISWVYDLRGPSMSIDTACSSSLVALHQAVKALQTGDASMALAGGVNLLMHPYGFVGFSKASMLSPRGRCRAFDATGDGYVRAEGGAVVVLKTLERALADGDTIHAVIAGSGVNSDGFTQGGISVPGTPTQAALLREVYARAQIDPRTVDYLEAHGTGTAVGDPIETRALADVVGAGRNADTPLLIGSVKTNIGHLETGSGMAGLLKAVLCLKHRAVPRSLHFEKPNPNIDFAGGNLRVVERMTPIGAHGRDLVVGVNSFGFGGTNAHVVLTQAPEQQAEIKAQAHADGFAPLVLTARSGRALATLAARYLARLDAAQVWGTLASAAAHRRQWLEHRAIIAPATLEEARAALAALANPESVEAQGDIAPAALVHAQVVADDAPVALVFSGNGSQWAGMGKQLLAEDAVFRAAVEEVDALWCADGSSSLYAMLAAGADADTLSATEHGQPLLFAIQVGIVRVIEAHGVAYDACVGHSVGEVAAAWASGALTLADAVQVVKIRSRAQALTRGTGRMAAAGIGEAEARELILQQGLTGDVEVAGINSVQSVTLAGSLAGLDVIGTALKATGRFYQLLDLDYAFHSRHMNGIEAPVREGLADIAPRAVAHRYVSTVTGGPLDGSALDAQYWWRNIREPVRFGDAIAHLVEKGVRLFVEVGPHSILRTYVKQTLAALKESGAPLPTLKRQHDSAATLHRAVLAAVAHGARVDRERLVPRTVDTDSVALPVYPWQHEHYWLVPTIEGYGLANRHRVHPLLGYRLHEHAFGWENHIDPTRLPYLADHVVDGGVTFPAAGFVEMALAAARVFFATETCALENVEIRQPVVFQANHAKLFRLVIDVRTAAFTIETRERMSDDAWSVNVVGRLLASGNTLDANSAIDARMLQSLSAQLAIDAPTLYAATESIGLTYGPAFRRVQCVRASGEAVLAELAAPQLSDDADLARYGLHPSLLDAGFHPLFALTAANSGDRAAWLPVQFGRIDYLRGDTIRQVLAVVERRSPHSVVVSFHFLDGAARVVARLAQCRFRRVDLQARRHAAPSHYTWHLEARPLAGGFDASALPAPAALLEEAQRVLASHDGQDAQKRRAMHLTEVLPLVDVLASGYALRAFEKIGAFRTPGLAFGPLPELAARLAAMLVEDGLARFEGDLLVREPEACEAMPPVDELWHSLLEQSPAHVAELTLLAHCGAALPALLSGEMAPEKLMSPTSKSLVEHFFEASPTWSHVRALIAALASRAVASWQAPRRLRVLEIGRSDVDVPRPLEVALPLARCDYAIACTAPQQAALAAEGGHSARLVTLVAGERLALQSDDDAPYDLVIANCLLTGQNDPLTALTALRGWLAPGAFVALAEPRRGRFGDIVFGPVRADAATSLNAADLVRLLEAAGFTDVVSFAEQGYEIEGTPALIVARAPIRQLTNTTTATSTALEPAKAPWLLVHADATADARAEGIADALRARGGDVELIAQPEVATALHAISAAHDGAPLHLVFVAPDAALPADADGVALMQAQRATSVALAGLVRELGACALPVQLSIVTQDGSPFALAEHDIHAPRRAEQATMWGLGRVLSNEHPELGCRLIDVSAACESAFEALAQELLAGDVEEEVLLTARGRFVPRMLDGAQAQRRAPENGTGHANAQGSVLAFDTPGSLRNLEWFAQVPRALEADEVEIEPVATGLNFRDVMYAMGLLSDEAVETGFAGATVGMELSGRVTRVGAGVSTLKAGDAVLGFAPASFATRVVTRAGAVTRKPASMTFEEAATVPTTFFTAWYALVELARVREGEHVLVHGGAGGVGIAAIQLARLLGAEVYATAGSREKREFVRLLGVDRVFDSRSLAFADQVRDATGGAGVDVVLNSLAGEAMVRSIDTLRPFGRFLELGKRDFYENSRIGLRPFRNNISYFGIDADQLMGALPELTTRLFEAVMQRFADGVLHPLPYRLFPAARVEEAFRYMQQARQIGKVLVGYPAGTPAPTRGAAHGTHGVQGASEAGALRCDAGGAYLVIGGTGGLGFATARWMVARGARHVTLASRSGTLSDAARAEVARWNDESGVQTHVVSCDVTNAAAVQKLVAQIAARGTPLKGVLHSAMHIDDGLVRNLDDARFEAVLAPKLAGAWNLHRATLDCALDFFIVYSSATTALGNPGQSSYVAANSFLEALVETRRAARLPGTFMAWGPLDDVGFLARNEKTREALQSRIGGASISSDEALVALERVLVAGGAGEAVVRLDWQALSRGMPAAGARRYAALRTRNANEPASDGGQPLRGRVAALPHAEALALVEETLRAQIARILHLAPEKVELERSVLDMGMDSLMGMELGLAVEEAFEVKLSVMAIAEGATVCTLAARIVESIEADAESADSPLDAQADAQNAAQAETAEAAAALARKHAIDVSAEELVE
ncbi:SDR family NAD(P)-dependent oxidoreductase [Paraburkholderia bannensis]|uniref:SDR family NAD(P)-dependent oxidoreductase n=1 Tax=Paraburkholderia bannensis TaxID=765414 RepID=UPI002AB730AF|nr:SDR family NAD(P)-dependent oxidoreductase [Paraburkholderia bannensis]